ncbi:MAG: hypothetical protein AB7P37_12080 [Ramlibacter sp.]
MSTLSSSAPALGAAPLLQRLPLRGVLAFDASTGIIMGLLLSLMPVPLSAWLGLPAALLLAAGLLLFPSAALMLLASARPHILLVSLVVFGNVAWVAASALVLVMMGPTVLGTVFVAGQAVVVAVLAWVEWQLRVQAR